MRQTKRIGIDFDDVLIDFNGSLAMYHNEVHGTSYTREQITTFNYFQATWGCDSVEALRRMRQFVGSEHHVRVSPIVGAVEAVRYLKEREHQLYIITARDETIRHPTLSVANMHFPGSFEETHFLHRNDENVLGTKGDVCRKLEIDVMIDDSLENVLHVAQVGIKALLFDTPWNQIKKLPENVTRVFSWSQILEEIE